MHVTACRQRHSVTLRAWLMHWATLLPLGVALCLALPLHQRLSSHQQPHRKLRCTDNWRPGSCCRYRHVRQVVPSVVPLRCRFAWWLPRRRPTNYWMMWELYSSMMRRCATPQSLWHRTRSLWRRTATGSPPLRTWTLPHPSRTVAVAAAVTVAAAVVATVAAIAAARRMLAVWWPSTCGCLRVTKHGAGGTQPQMATT